MPQIQFYVYILANHTNGVLYIGVTRDLMKRVWEHKNNVVPGFTSKYNVHKLVYFEIFQTSYDAITREKQLKGGSRKKKEVLINTVNPKWEDLYKEII